MRTISEGDIVRKMRNFKSKDRNFIVDSVGEYLVVIRSINTQNEEVYSISTLQSGHFKKHSLRIRND